MFIFPFQISNRLIIENVERYLEFYISVKQLRSWLFFQTQIIFGIVSISKLSYIRSLFFDFRISVNCTEPNSIMAHLPENDSCVEVFWTIYYTCRNNTWMLDFNHTEFAPVDQIFCFVSERSNNKYIIYKIKNKDYY